MNYPRTLAVGLLVVCVALFASACGRIRNPEGWASPIVSDQTIYYFTSKNRLGAVNLDTAAAVPQPGSTTGLSAAPLLWRFPTDAQAKQGGYDFRAAYTAPVRDGDTFYFAGYEGQLYRVSIPNGAGEEIKTSADVKGKIVGGVVLSGDMLVFGTTEGRLYAINKNDGSPAPGWPKSGIDFGDGIWAPPVLKDGVLYIAQMDGHIRAVNLADGKEAWSEPFQADGAIPDLTLIGDVLFAPSIDRHVYLVGLDGKLRQKFTAGDWVWTKPAVKDTVAYFGDFSGKVYALDITTGQDKWDQAYDAKTKVKAAPALIGDVLVLVDSDPVVHFLDAATGKELNSVPIPGSGTVRAPVAAAPNGMAYIATTKGKLFAADPQKRTVVEVPVVTGGGK